MSIKLLLIVSFFTFNNDFLYSANVCSNTKEYFMFWQRYYSAGGKGHTDFLLNVRYKYLNQLLKIKDNQKFINTVHKYIEFNSKQTKTFYEVSRKDLDFYVKNFSESKLNYLPKIIHENAISKYNKLYERQLSELPESDYNGAEGELFLIKNKNIRYKILKIWTLKPKQFENSYKALNILYNIVNYSSVNLSKHMEVVKTYEVNFKEKFIVRDFVNNDAVELKSVIQENKDEYKRFLNKIETNKTFKLNEFTNKALCNTANSIILIEKLIKDKKSIFFQSPLLKKLRTAIRKPDPSANVLWSKKINKLVVIDTPGY